VDLRDITVRPIGVVSGGRTEPIDDDWGGIETTIVLDDRFPTDALAGLDDFSHVEIVFVFDRVDDTDVVGGARHPRGNTEWPKVGIFAQRARMRPNRIGVTRCELLGVDGRNVRVRGLDAMDGTPVLDVKPHMRGFDARGEVHEPEWAVELMRDYW
jgi:tRNA-Thr(GGU) m(6)t(6)A37 methyltransferase TsaA